MIKSFYIFYFERSSYQSKSGLSFWCNITTPDSYTSVFQYINRFWFSPTGSYFDESLESIFPLLNLFPKIFLSLFVRSIVEFVIALMINCFPASVCLTHNLSLLSLTVLTVYNLLNFPSVFLIMIIYEKTYCFYFSSL